MLADHVYTWRVSRIELSAGGGKFTFRPSAEKRLAAWLYPANTWKKQGLGWSYRPPNLLLGHVYTGLGYGPWAILDPKRVQNCHFSGLKARKAPGSRAVPRVHVGNRL